MVSVVQDSRKRDASIVLETPFVAIRLSVELTRFAWRKSPATSIAIRGVAGHAGQNARKAVVVKVFEVVCASAQMI